MIKDKSYILTILIFIIIFVVSGCGGNKVGSEEFVRLDKECSEALMLGDMRANDSIAVRILSLGIRNNSPLILSTAHYYLGTYRRNAPKPSSWYISHLDTALQLVDVSDHNLTGRILNARGLWELSKLNFPLSLLHFEHAMKEAEISGNERLGYTVESNLAELYRLMADTLGYEHSRQLFQRSTERGYEDLRQSSAIACGIYLAEHSEDSLELHKYLMALDDERMGHPWSDLIRAEYLVNREKYEEADSIIGLLPDETMSYVMPVFMKAFIEAGLGRYGESNSWAEICLEMYDAIHQDNRWPEMYKLMAENYYKMGDYKSAYVHLQHYSTANDSIDSNRSTNEIKAWKVKYDVEKKERMIVQAKSEASRWRFIVALVASVLAVTIMSFLLYLRYRRRYYRRIVAQSKDAVRRENELIARCEMLQTELAGIRTDSLCEKSEPTESGDSGGSVVSDISIDGEVDMAPSKNGLTKLKIDEIFDRICHEMDVNRVWADVNMSREVFADIVGCNRTYFSAVIKEKTGLSYTQYINRRRVHEVVRLMTDSDESLTLEQLSKKVGFLSESNFYTVFRQTMGMTPAAFRKIAGSDSASSAEE